MQSFIALSLFVFALAVVNAGVVKHEEENGPAYYKFNYGVYDPHTGDKKEHYESRDGHVVKGGYTMQEADGTVRVVEYTAGPHKGFNAIVKRLGVATHPQVYKSYGGYNGGGAKGAGGEKQQGGFGGTGYSVKESDEYGGEHETGNAISSINSNIGYGGEQSGYGGAQGGGYGGSQGSVSQAGGYGGVKESGFSGAQGSGFKGAQGSGVQGGGYGGAQGVEYNGAQEGGFSGVQNEYGEEQASGFSGKQGTYAGAPKAIVPAKGLPVPAPIQGFSKATDSGPEVARSYVGVIHYGSPVSHH